MSNTQHPAEQAANLLAHGLDAMPPLSEWARVRGTIDGLNYALNIARGRRALNRTPDYLAAIDEMEIFLLAAIERVDKGEPMSATAVTQ